MGLNLKSGDIIFLISLFPLDIDIADHVVEMRAKYPFKTPDVIQLGTAVACGADDIITNDKA
jgi:hypothetical protein